MGRHSRPREVFFFRFEREFAYMKEIGLRYNTLTGFHVLKIQFQTHSRNFITFCREKKKVLHVHFISKLFVDAHVTRLFVHTNLMKNEPEKFNTYRTWLMIVFNIFSSRKSNFSIDDSLEIRNGKIRCWITIRTETKSKHFLTESYGNCKWFYSIHTQYFIQLCA